MRRTLVVTSLLTLLFVVSPAIPAHAVSGGDLTIMFGRTQWTKATSSCNAAPGFKTLADAVSALAAEGHSATGEAVTSYISETGLTCTNGALYPSWGMLSSLQAQYGFNLISEGTNYLNFSAMSTQDQISDSCGSLAAFTTHGFARANGLFAYPDNTWTLPGQ